MAIVQNYFEEFHSNIRTGYKYHKELKDKRDTLINNLQSNLGISFDYFYQGSYAMHTGVKPLDSDYDIDVGLIFTENSYGEFSDPVELKKKIKEALRHSQRTVKIKRPCVTVQYIENGDHKYHVDFAVYRIEYFTGNIEFGRGKPDDDDADCVWGGADPKGLISIVNNKYTESEKLEREQYKRCIRALKRWKNIKISHKNFPSIALTVAAAASFTPCFFDDEKTSPDDASALIKLLRNLDGDVSTKHIFLPVNPYSNLLDALTNTQRDHLRKKIDRLIVDLEKCQDPETTISTACSKLRKHFGNDFPVDSATKALRTTEEFMEDRFIVDRSLVALNISLDVENYPHLLSSLMQRIGKGMIYLPQHRRLLFKVENIDDLPVGVDFYWKVRNVGIEAEKRNMIRGQIVKGSKVLRETTSFSGEHYVECYAVQGSVCIASGVIEVPIG